MSQSKTPIDFNNKKIFECNNVTCSTPFEIIEKNQAQGKIESR